LSDVLELLSHVEGALSGLFVHCLQLLSHFCKVLLNILELLSQVLRLLADVLLDGGFAAVPPPREFVYGVPRLLVAGQASGRGQAARARHRQHQCKAAHSLQNGTPVGQF